MSSPKVRAGWQTTEFWIAVLGNLLGILAMLGVLPDVGELPDGSTAPWGQLVGAAVVSVSNLAYAISRGLAKLR